jgi:hypothetical protein
MAEIQRTIVLGEGSDVSSLDKDMDVVFEALNQGMDPTSLPPGKLTADKFFITSPGTGSTGFRMGSGGQVGAGQVGIFLLGVNGPNQSSAGLGSGQYYILTPYADFFIDPTGSAGGPLTINNIYTGNTAWTGLGLILPSVFFRNSANAAPQEFQVMCAVHNIDSVAHYIYCSVNVSIINTQASA